MSEKVKDIALLILSIFIACLILIYQHTYENYNNAQHNYITMCDSMKVINTKYSGLVYENNSLITSKKDLQEQLDISKKEYKDLEKKLNSTIAYYSNLSGKVEYDTIIMTDTVWKVDDITYVRFSYMDKWAVVDGVTRMDTKPQTTINLLSIDVPLHVGLTNDYTIFVNSDNPYVTFTDIQGAVIDGSKLYPKQKRFGVGLHAGFGVQYNLLRHNIGIGPQVGIGINYKIF